MATNNCYLLGVDERNFTWLSDKVRNFGFNVFDIPDTRLVSIHDIDSMNQPKILFDNIQLNETDRIFYFGVPRLPTHLLDPEILDFVYSEWRASIESAISKSKAKVINGAWIMKNCSLRSSDDYWTLLCRKKSRCVETNQFEWYEGSANCDNALNESVIEIAVTRKRWFIDHPNIIEMHSDSVIEAFLKIQDVLIDEKIDFLRIWVSFEADGGLIIQKASAEMPIEASDVFCGVLHDCL